MEIGIFVIWNLLVFILYGIDKYKALKGRWRIKESFLLTLAFLLGGLGAFMGSIFFKHKTNKLKFKILLHISIFINVLIIYFWGLLR